LLAFVISLVRSRASLQLEIHFPEPALKANCLSLVSSAILVWNTLEIAKVVEALRRACTPIADEDLALVSLLMHR
jgi:hypothetical protein